LGFEKYDHPITAATSNNAIQETTFGIQRAMRGMTARRGEGKLNTMR